MIEKKSWGKTAKGEEVELYTLRNGKTEVSIATWGAAVTSLRVPDRNGAIADIVLGFDSLEPYTEGAPVLRRGRRTLRQPDRAGALHARPQGIQADDQQRQEPAARRARGLLSQGLEGRGGRGQGRPGAEADLREPRRRRGLSRHADRQRDLHADRRRRAAHGVHRDHRQAHGGEPDQPRLLQPVGAGRGRHPRRRADGQGRALHAGRRDVDPDRRAAQRGQHAVRLPQADRAGRAHRRARRRS